MEFTLYLLLNLVLTAFLYLLAPVIIILCYKDKKLNKKQIKRITIINGIVIWLLCMVVRVEKGIDGTSSAVFLWSWVAYILMKRFCLGERKTITIDNEDNAEIQADNIVGVVENDMANKEVKLESIYYFNYTKEIGFYDSLRKIQSNEIKYIGLALSTPKVRVNATPSIYFVTQNGSDEIRAFVSKNLLLLKEIDQELAESLEEYIMFCYDDESKRYFEYNTEFLDVFKIAESNKIEQTSKEPNYNSPFAIQKEQTYKTSQTQQNTTKPTINKVESPVDNHYTKENIKYCSSCGSIIDPVTKVCSGCHKQYIRWKSILRIACVILLIISLPLNIILAVCTRELNIEKEELKKELNKDILELHQTIQKEEIKYNELYRKYNTMKKKLDAYEAIVVFIEDNKTYYYHTYDCDEFVGEDYWAFNIEYAEYKGYKPCPKCYN